MGLAFFGGKIVFDAGLVIMNGYSEAKMRGWTAPVQGVIKSHPLSGWEIKNEYTHYAQEGSFWNWRIGENYKAFKMLAASLGISDRQEERVGDSAAVNDGNPHTYRVEWADGTVRFLFDGEELTGWTFPRFQLRYFTIGKDDQYDITDPTPIISDIQIVDRDAESPNQPPVVVLPDLTVAEDDTLIIPRAQMEVYIQDPDDVFEDLKVMLEGDTVHFGWNYDVQNGLKIWPLPVHWNKTVDFTLTVIDSSGTLDVYVGILTVMPVNDAPGDLDLLNCCLFVIWCL